MKTNQQNQNISFNLKDGHSRLAEWTLPVDHPPSLYDSIEIPERLRKTLKGYDTKALVTRIEVGNAPAFQVDLEAVCLKEKALRPIIVLNPARISDSIKDEIEAWLRTQLELPLVYWESSALPQPVIRFFDPATRSRVCPEDIQSGILQRLSPRQRAA